jgi:hypothetical protein
MKKQILLATSLLVFIFHAAIASNTLSKMDVAIMQVANAFPQDSLEGISFPENFAVELETMVKAGKPIVNESALPKNTDPKLAKASGWAEFFYINDNQSGWQELSSAQLFYSNGQEIIGYVYGHNDMTTPFGPSCYITDSDYNYQVEGYTGAAFKCSTGEVFFFFSEGGTKYLVIYYNYRTRLYSN